PSVVDGSDGNRGWEAGMETGRTETSRPRPSSWAEAAGAVGIRGCGDSAGKLAAAFPHALQARLGVQFFLLHAGKGDVVERQYADLGVVHLAVEFPMVLVQAAEFRIRLHQCLDVITLLVFKHDPTSS